MRLIQNIQFDTVYHEHFSYLLYTVSKIFAAAGLKVFDVEELGTHGGSIRVYGCHADDQRSQSNSVDDILNKEIEEGLQELETYANFQEKADEIKNNLLTFLIAATL